MGTDIHHIFQAKGENGEWTTIKDGYDGDRHYALFAHLADVRNGYGFAGVPTGTPVTPIAEPRGLPEEFEDDYYIDDVDDEETWLGDHSHSWLTAEEILGHDFSGGLKYGVIDIEAFRAWDGVGYPDSYCGDVSGHGVKVNIPSEIDEDTTHVRVVWSADKTEYDYFLEEVERLKSEHGEVRMVFGFDS